LEIDKDALIQKLKELGAEDLGEDLLSETIFYDKDGQWLKDKKKFIRVRSNKSGNLLTYKHHFEYSATGTTEIELTISDTQKITDLLTELGYPPFRKQEKKRHTFKLKGAQVEIDTWPKIPTYVEIEGSSEDELKQTASLMGLNWQDAVFKDAGSVIAEIYNIPVHTLKYFTFDKIE
jgi:adenylate cyclase class 2